MWRVYEWMMRGLAFALLVCLAGCFGDGSRAGLDGCACGRDIEIPLLDWPSMGWVALSLFCLDAKTLYLYAIHHFQNRETHPQSQCSFSSNIGKVKPT